MKEAVDSPNSQKIPQNLLSVVEIDRWITRVPIH